eukprot:SAG22_NODE_522_length_9503_cov_4.233624_11_plen_369_part_00
MPPMAPLLALLALRRGFPARSFSAPAAAATPRAQNWTVVRKAAAAVMGPSAAHKHGIAGGFEGGEFFRTSEGGEPTYHYFATEMVQSGANLWVGTRGGHWTAKDPSLPEQGGCNDRPQPCSGHPGRTFCPNRKAPDQCGKAPVKCPPCPGGGNSSGAGSGWARQSTLFTSSGRTDGSDRASAKWAPMVNFGYSPENKSNVYTLWYVAYRSGAPPNSTRPSGHWANWDGQVRRMVSTVAGNSSAALAGPYVDVGVVLDSEQPDAAAWEGLQGTDSVNCYRLPNGTWLMFYGTTLDACPGKTSARLGCASGFQRLGRTVAFASSPTLGGPWKRLQMEQQTIEPMALQASPNMEVPRTTKTHRASLLLAWL